MIRNHVGKVLFGGLSMFVVVNNVMGNDDKNLLLGVTSPPIWVMNSWSFVESIPMWVFYVTTIGFWLLVGYGFDVLVKRLFRRRGSDGIGLSDYER